MYLEVETDHFVVKGIFMVLSQETEELKGKKKTKAVGENIAQAETWIKNMTKHRKTPEEAESFFKRQLNKVFPNGGSELKTHQARVIPIQSVRA